MKLRRAERRGRADARRSRWADRRARGARRPRGARHATASASAGCSIVSSACSAATARYVEIQRHCRRDEEADNQTLVAMAEAFRVPVVATNGVRFATPRRAAAVRRAHVHPPPHRSRPRGPAAGAERRALSQAAGRDGRAVRRLSRRRRRARASWPIGCSTRWPISATGFRTTPCRPGRRRSSFLRQLTDVGARDRYRPYHDRARAQIARELDLIEKLELAGYFLIVWDIVNFCRQHDILVQGRGSAANSAVCYSLGITAVDPVGMDLLFERFLSEERGEWPDIDLDLPSGDRREQVIQHVYEKYGRLRRGDDRQRHHLPRPKRGARSGQGARLRSRADRSAGEGDEQLRVHRCRPIRCRATWRRSASICSAERVRLFARLWRQMQDLPRHLGQHSGGMVICQGQLDAVRAARERQHARPRRRAVGQGRLRRHGHRQSRPARARHDGGAAGRPRAGQRRSRRH